MEAPLNEEIGLSNAPPIENINNDMINMEARNKPWNRGRRGGNRGGRLGGQSIDGSYNRNVPDGRKSKTAEDRVHERLAAISAPTYDLVPREMSVKKFSGHCRLFVGNLAADMKEDEFIQIFKPYGEVAEIFLNTDKAFGFIKLDYRSNAERAKLELDGTVHKGRSIKIRFAAHGAALRIKNLSPFVSNELLEKAFSVFGEIEKAVVIVDSKGKTLGEGIVEFAAKPAAYLALKMCQEGCFFLTQSPRPVIVEPLIEQDEDEGCLEKNMPKKNRDYIVERELGPRFAKPSSFEYEYGLRWKALYDLEKQKRESLEAEMKYEREKLEEQMDYAKFEHETNLLREQLHHREMEKEKQIRDHELRLRQREEMRRQEEEMYRRNTDDITQVLQRREEDMRRRMQENTLFLQANQLNNLLDQQEAVLRGANDREYTWNNDQTWIPPAPPSLPEPVSSGPIPGNIPNVIPQDGKQFLEKYEGQATYEGQGYDSYYSSGYVQGGLYDPVGGTDKNYNPNEANLPLRGGSWSRSERLPREDFAGGNPKRRRY